MGDRPLDRRIDLLLRRSCNPLVSADVHLAGGDVLDRLTEDLQALAHLLHADEVAGIAIAGGSAADLEVVIGVGKVGLVLPQVTGDAAGAGHGACGAAVDRLLLREHADALRAVDEDPVAGQQPFHVVERLGEGAEEGADLLDHQRREIMGDPADPGVAVGEPGSAERLENVVDHLALVEAVEEEGERSRVEPHRAVAEEVVTDPGQFGDDRADHLATWRQIDPQERLHGVVPGDVVGHRRDVVHPVGDRHVLVEREVLADLLKA